MYNQQPINTPPKQTPQEDRPAHVEWWLPNSDGTWQVYTVNSLDRIETWKASARGKKGRTKEVRQLPKFSSEWFMRYVHNARKYAGYPPAPKCLDFPCPLEGTGCPKPSDFL